MAVLEGADPQTNTDLSGIHEFAMHILQIQAIKLFPEVKLAQTKNLLPDTFSCRQSSRNPNQSNSPGCKSMGWDTDLKDVCTREGKP